MLELEESRWRYPGAKDQAIRSRLGLTPTAYYQMLNALLDREAAMAHRPLLVQRLRRARGTRRRAARPAQQTLTASPTPAQET